MTGDCGPDRGSAKSREGQERGAPLYRKPLRKCSISEKEGVAAFTKESIRFSSKSEVLRLRALTMTFSREKLESLCRRYHIRRLSLFGSILKDNFHPGSDVDVLVEFDPDHVPGFFQLTRIERELSELLSGYKVDLRTAEDLSRYFRDEVLAAAEALYEEG